MFNETASKTAAKPRGLPSRHRHADRPGEPPDTAKKSAGDQAKRGTSTGRTETVVTVPASFFEPPLIQGESRADYDAVFKLIEGGIAPTDFIELMWVKDVADLAWESRRARLLRVKFIDAVRSQVWGVAAADGILKRVGAGGLGSERAVSPEVRAKLRDLRGLITKAESGEATPVETIDKMLTKTSVTIDEDAVDGRAFVDAIDQLEKVDALIASSDQRRDMVLREIERRRDQGIERIRKVLRDLDHEVQLKEELAAQPVQKQGPTKQPPSKEESPAASKR